MPAPAAKETSVEVTAEAGAHPFDMDMLIERLKKTNAIGLLTKLAIRSDAMDIIDRVKRAHAKNSDKEFNELRARFEGLLLKVLALLEDDPELGHDIYLAREQIWQSLLEVKT